MKTLRLFEFAAIFVLIGILSSSCDLKKARPSLKKPVIKGYNKIVGLVEVCGKDICIVSNYNSRSRVSYCVEGKLENEIVKLKGKVIEVKGETQRIGWSGTIKVEKIVKVIGNANRENHIYKGIQPKGR